MRASKELPSLQGRHTPVHEGQANRWVIDLDVIDTFDATENIVRL
jgi:hypothetical protein